MAYLITYRAQNMQLYAIVYVTNETQASGAGAV
jgi:hypothetical protein